MERLRILKAALALEDFTINELAAHAAANLNTTRHHVTTRDAALYEVVRAEASEGRGRPRSRYALRDPEHVREILREDQRARTPADQELIERAAAPLVLPTVVVDTSDSDLPAADRLEWAASRLELARRSEDGEDRQAYARLAQSAAQEVLDDLEAEGNSALVLQATVLRAFADLLVTVAGTPGENPLAAAAAAVATLVQQLPTAFAGRLLQTLTSLARQFGEGPPIAVVAHAHVHPRSVLLGLGGTDWLNEPLEGSGDSVWWPSWASPLYECTALAGVVIDRAAESGDPRHLDDTIRLVKSWRRPTVVCNFEMDQLAIQYVLRHGAAPQPTFDAETVVSYIDESLEDLALGTNVGASILDTSKSTLYHSPPAEKGNGVRDDEVSIAR